MGRILISIAGPWREPPAIDSDVPLEFGPADPELAAAVESIGRRAQVSDDRDVSAIHRHRAVLQAAAEFEGPGDLGPATQVARLLIDAFEAGAVGAYVETAVKVFGAGALSGIAPDDAVALFHLFVEVWGDDTEVCTEGMQAFDLPDVAVPYDAADAGPAQAAAFGLAARMVCDGALPVEGERYRASESAPWYVVRGRPAEVSEDPYTNTRGAWVLDRA